MRALPSADRKRLESAVLTARRAAESACRVAIDGLGVFAAKRPDHLDADQAALRNGLRAKLRQLNEDRGSLIAECAYEQWHRLLFARFLAENNLLLHPQYEVPVSLGECAELAADLGEPDAWSVAARFASEILPGIFRLDDPCVRLRLAPEGRHDLEEILDSLAAELFHADDALGWVYQYWQKDKKDEVNASERKIGGADLGPVTQLFTENYMVRFLLENSLGAWWAAGHPESPLVKDFEYLRFDDNGQPAAGSFDSWPDRVAEVTVMDPCCGSGHFLVETFSMLWQMRVEEEGLSPCDAQDAVLRENLFGLEIDSRCVQIAMFAIALLAWKAGGGWRPLPVSNIACSGLPVTASVEEWKSLAVGDERIATALVRLHSLFREADTLGSLIDPHRTIEYAQSDGSQHSTEDVEWHELSLFLQSAVSSEVNDSTPIMFSRNTAGLTRAAILLSKQYTLIATNVPFLSRSKQVPSLRAYVERRFHAGVMDLATAFILRSLDFGLSVALVTPQGWHQQHSFEALRELVLTRFRYRLVARLGNNCWQNRLSSPLFKFHTALSVINRNDESGNHIVAIDIGNGLVGKKASDLRDAAQWTTSQRGQLNNPEARLTLRTPRSGRVLSQYCSASTGVQTGDSPRYILKFWEIPMLGRWILMQSTALLSAPYTGREHILDWDNGSGSLSRQEGAYLRNTAIWGSLGVAIKQMGDLHATLYTGEAFDNNTVVLVPNDPADLEALWAFTASPDYAHLVREINSRPYVTTTDLVKVPMEMEYFRQEAHAAGAIPEPWSGDPTQWLFEGSPQVSTEPLQVAVGRLLGYGWPEAKPDGLKVFADNDGIVCLPAVAGEARAADQVQQILVAAYGDAWSPAKLKELLAQSGSKKKNLTDWLRDHFFKQHCALFHNRPFIWHIWDGLKDGFSALVNYHVLDRKNLSKLTYTYLGQDWVERQRADIKNEVANAETRLVAALELKRKLELILDGEQPHDIYVRWKERHEQPIGWEPDLNDGVRLNLRPFVTAGVLRSPLNVHWKKDRGKNSDGSERHNDIHLSLADKAGARRRAGLT